MKLVNNQDSIWQLCKSIVPVVFAAGRWSLLGLGNVAGNTKDNTSGRATTRINSTVTEVDVLLQEMILREVLGKYENITPLGEEDTPHNRIETEDIKEFFLAIDPLDGTYAFTQGQDDYCTMISLFSGRELLAGLIHFPKQAESWVGIKGDGLFLIKAGKHDSTDPYLVDGMSISRMTPCEPEDEQCLAVHYRFLKEPYSSNFASVLAERQYKFKTLFGDKETEAFDPETFGSNGSLARDMFLGGSVAYLGPYVAYHDVLPLASLVVAAGGEVRFYVADNDGKWIGRSTADTLAHCIEGGKRCRVIAAMKASVIDEIEVLLG